MSYDTFNKNLERFLADLISNFNDIQEFKQLKTGIIFTKSINEKTPERLFRKNIVDNFRKQIVLQDENFFLNQNTYSCIDDEEFKKVDNIQFNTLFKKLSDIWITLSNDNKDKIWKWIKVLIVLSDKLNNHHEYSQR